LRNFYKIFTYKVKEEPMKLIRGCLVIALLAVFAIVLAEQAKAGDGRITWAPVDAMFDHAVLTVGGPGDFYFEKSFRTGAVPCFSAVDQNGVPFPDGSYTYELRKIPLVSPEVKKALASARETGDRSAIEELENSGNLPQTYNVESGYFSIQSGSVITNDMPEPQPQGDVLHYDDVIITGSLCVGFDCINGESFGYDTIRLKENNLRIKFEDTSIGSFPTNDWQIIVNDSTSGGASYFSIEDVTNGTRPFTIEADAPSNSLYVEDYGRVGLGTSTPVVELHIKDSDTPTVRLEQDSSGGWAPQTWDVAGHEGNFFIRDATNGSLLPFRIQPNTPTSTLCLKSTGTSIGKVGIGTWEPTATLHVEGDAYIKTSLEIGSSRELKENINELPLNAAVDALKELKPVRFHYKAKPDENLGFISEDVPDLVATKSRKSINTMDIVALLTRVVQEQQEVIKKQQEDISRLYSIVEELKQGIKFANRTQQANTDIGSPQPKAQVSSFTELKATPENEGEI
jgi:hypothetical protein